METCAPSKPEISLKWKEIIAKLLHNDHICGLCLSVDENLDHLDTVFHIANKNIKRTIKDIIEFVFGNSISKCLPTKHICQRCLNIILESYFMLKNIKTNDLHLQQYFNTITQQVNLPLIIEESTEKQLMLMIDNVNRLKVPSIVTVSKKPKEVTNIMQIFVTELKDDFDIDISTSDTNNTDILKYECSYCGKQFKDYIVFREHFDQHKDVYFRCPTCNKRSKVFKELINHRNLGHKERLRACYICKIIILSSQSTEHEKEHNNQLICHLCQTTFDSKTSLDDHIVECHSYVSCELCQKTFGNVLKLRQHSCVYKCPECKQDCIHDQYLSSYREQHMAKRVVYKCPECDFKYSNRSQIIHHANEEHLHHYPYLCDTCGDSFASRPLLTNHINKTHPEDQIKDQSVIINGPVVSADVQKTPHECKVCGFYFNSKESYTIHLKRHTSRETECHFCETSFSNIGKLNLHIKNHHPEEVNGHKTAVYRCTMCPLDFNFRTEFIEHISTHPEGTMHVCRECKDTFEHKNAYSSHIRKHRIKYDKECLICFKKYTKNTIQRHMAKHAEKNELATSAMCHLCGEFFESEVALMKHAKKHQEQRQCPYCNKNVNSVLYAQHVNTHVQSDKLKSCADCDYTTRFSVCLEAHINRYHLKVRPYQCPICNKDFYSAYTLKEHSKTHKNRRPTHYCHICGNKFISKKAVMLHTRLHTGETPYPCDICDLRFISSSRLRQHKIRKHFEPSIECQLCLKKLYTQSDLRRHIGDCHDGESKRKRKKNTEPALVEQEVEEEQSVFMDTET